MARGQHPDQPSSVSRYLILLLTGLAFIVQIGFDVNLVRSTFPPTVGEGRDLLAFVTAGKIAADEQLGPEVVYDLEVQRSVQERLTGKTITPGTGLPFIHPPHLLPVQRALAPLDYAGFLWRWWAIMAALFLLGFAILDGSLGRAGGSTALRLAFIAVGIAFGPVVISLVQGQDTALLYLAIAGWLVAFSARRDLLAGFALSLATIRPHIALVLALPFLFARRRVLLGFVSGSTLLVVWSLAQVGVTGFVDYAHIVLGLAGGLDSGVGLQDRVSLVGIMERSLPGSTGSLARGLTWGVWLGLIGGLCILWSRRRPNGGPFPSDLGIAVVLAIAFAPHMNLHDLSLIHAAATPILVFRSGSGQAYSDWWGIAGLLGISLAVSLATLSGVLVRDLLIASGFGIALVLFARAGVRRTATRHVSFSGGGAG